MQPSFRLVLYRMFLEDLIPAKFLDIDMKVILQRFVKDFKMFLYIFCINLLKNFLHNVIILARVSVFSLKYNRLITVL